jgi:hypothetical protein
VAYLSFCKPGTAVVEIGQAGVASGRGAEDAWPKTASLLSASISLVHFASPSAFEYSGMRQIDTARLAASLPSIVLSSRLSPKHKAYPSTSCASRSINPNLQP